MSSGVQVRCLSVQVFRCLGVYVFRCLGVQVFRCLGVQVFRCSCVHVFMCVQDIGSVLIYSCTPCEQCKVGSYTNSPS